MDVQQALDYIYSAKMHGAKKDGLRNITALMDYLGNPQRSYRAVHVTGTNGKGSICAYCQRMLMAAGYKVGMFISPYIESFNERFQIDEANIPDDELIACVELVKAAVERMVADGRTHPTWFEINTAIGFLYFARQKVDFAVVEVGVGGRLDCTNILLPEVSVIGSISLDHTKILGDTLEKIAYEKGGIIKPDTPAVWAPQQPEAHRRLAQIAEERHAPCYLASDARVMPKSDTLAGQRFDWVYGERRLADLEIRLLGAHQLENASCAILAMLALSERGVEIPEAAIRSGLAQTRWPGRLEIMHNDPMVMLDGAHNPGAARVLAQAVRHYFPERPITLVMGMMGDKQVEPVVELLAPLARRVIVTIPDTFAARAASLDNLQALFARHGQTDVAQQPDPRLAIDQAMADCPPDGVVLVAGSLYLVGIARTHLRNRA